MRIHRRLNKLSKKKNIGYSLNSQEVEYKQINVFYCKDVVSQVQWPGSCLVPLCPDQAVQVCALAGDIVLCSWAGHFTLTVPLSTQVYKWVRAKLMQGGG